MVKMKGVIVTSITAAKTSSGKTRVRKNPIAVRASPHKLPRPFKLFKAAYPRLTPIDIARRIAGISKTP